MPIISTPSERIGLCTRMRRFPVRFIRPGPFVHTRSDTSVSGQRCADLPASSADRSHHFKSDPWRTSSPLHPNLGFRYPQSRLVARTSVTDVTRQPATAIALQYSRSLLSLERQTRAVVRPGMRKMVRRENMERFDMSRPMHQIGNSRTNPLQTEHHRQMSTCSEHSRRRSKV
jgi:hypothetical protein